MSDQLWVVRAGREARFVDEFIANSYVSISFHEFAADDLSLTTEAALKDRVKSPAERSYAGQLIAFTFRMQVGDLIIVPRLTGSNRDYLVARVMGPYQHVVKSAAGQETGSGNHRRLVEWLGAFARDDLSPSAANTMGSISTLFRPSAAEAELRALLTSLTPLGAAKPVGTPRSTNRGPTASHGSTQAQPLNFVSAPQQTTLTQFDIEIDGQGRARMSSGHPALVMEQISRHVEPSRDWSGVPGIYVLTGTELQHSFTRTGNERTLTTTLIVRPWAYVGLSEDFLGRIGSHRQSKPEWRRALLVRSGGLAFASDDIKYLEQRVHSILDETNEVALGQSPPRGNLSAHPRNTVMLDACADTVVAVLRLTGTLI